MFNRMKAARNASNQTSAARKAATSRHAKEVSELKRFWNLLLRGMEVKLWRQEEEEDEALDDGISDEVLALGNSVLSMMSLNAASNEIAHKGEDCGYNSDDSTVSKGQKEQEEER